MAVDPRWRENQEVAQAASGSANELIPALRRVIESGAWREFVHPMHGLTHYDRFTDYCREFLELEPSAVEALAGATSATRAARIVRELIRQDIEPTGPNGGSRVKGEQSRITRLTDSDTADRVVATLKKRDPDLAAQVVAGELSAHAAALAAGIRKPRGSFRTDDVGLAVTALLKHFTADQITAALAATTKGENR